MKPTAIQAELMERLKEKQDAKDMVESVLRRRKEAGIDDLGVTLERLVNPQYIQDHRNRTGLQFWLTKKDIENEEG